MRTVCMRAVSSAEASSGTPSSALSIARADVKRAAGSFSSARMTAASSWGGMPGRCRLGGGGGEDLLGDLDRGARLERAAGADAVLEASGLDVLHGDECGRAVRPVVVDRDDVRVVEPGGHARLALEAGQEVGVAGVFVAQD